MATLAAIGWFVEVLFDKSLTILGHGFKYWAAADRDLLPDAVDNLKSAMANVLALFSRVKNYMGENEGILILLKALKGVAYDADDLLSELDYYRIQQQVEGDIEINNNKTFGGFLSHMLNRGDDNKDRMVSRINKVVDQLRRYTDDIHRLLPQHTQEVNPLQSSQFVTPSHRVTTSRLPPKLTVFGRDEERDHIIELLLANQIATTSVAEPLPDVAVLPIVGMGGIGKTTLARMVYKDKRVTENFDCMLWLCVSKDFDVVRLLREMLQCLNVHQSEITNVDLLQQRLRERLCSTKFLLVLDDVWNEAESVKWETFCASLVDGKPGSRILMTTRLPTVVSIVRDNMDILGGTIELKGLLEDDYLSLFYKYAFRGTDPHDPVLVEIGKQIAVKLKGNPLAAKTVGGMLQVNLDHAHWRSILSSNVWELEQSPDDIMPVLRLSCQHLPPHLQQCFAYCGVFPKGWNFNKDQLVRMWISQGYITSKSERLEDVGSKYIDSLMSRSFFQGDVGDLYFVIHDLLHDLAESVSGDECFRLHGSEPTKVPEVVRHLFVRSTDISILQGCSLRNLRTLIIFNGYERCDCTILEGVLKELRSVRVLLFEFLTLDRLPVNIDHLIHLRRIYILSQKLTVSTIPESWCMLYHLQFLRADSFTATLPADINNLINLRHCMGISFRRVAGIGKMTSLQNLEFFQVGEDDGRKLSELKNLNELSGYLYLEDLQNVTTKKEALDAKLSKKVYIQELNLKWRDCQSPEVADEVIEGLQPPYIQKLKISGFCGVKSPSWMMPPYESLSRLQSLELENCINWKDLPPIGEIPLLKNLVIRGIPQWVVWSRVLGDSGSLFRCLHKLELSDCPKLEHVPLQVLTSLRELKIHSCDIIIHIASLESLADLKSFTIGYCRELQSLPLLPASLVELYVSHCDELQVPTLSKLTSLEILKIDNCKCFMSLLSTDREENLSYLTSLRELTVSGCPHLQFLPRMPATLEALCLRSLDQFIRFTIDPEDNLSYLTSLKRLEVHECPLLEFLPRLPINLEWLHLNKLNLFTLFTTDPRENLSYITALVGLRVEECPLLEFLPCLPIKLEMLYLNKLNLFTRFTTDPGENLSCPTSLSQLTIHWCPLLQFLPLLLAKLKYLWVHRCDRLPFNGCDQLPFNGGDNWHNISHVPRIEWD